MEELAAGGIPVAVSLRVLGIARAPYYRWLAEPVTQADWNQALRADALFDAHRDDPDSGTATSTKEWPTRAPLCRPAWRGNSARRTRGG